ncbi:MAG TPA: trypsin-like peptidase domain-containing protein [Nitrospiria bacterium]|jgi:serine protease Do
MNQLKEIKLKTFFLLGICSLMVLLVNSNEAFGKKKTEGLELLEKIQSVFVDIAERVKPTVVNISPKEGGSSSQNRKTPNAPPSGSGSGVIIDQEGYIITNNHVVGEAMEVEVRLSNRSKFVGTVVGKDPDTDLALIKIQANEPLAYAPVGNSDQIKVGQWAMAVGNPFGLDRTVTIGVISGIGREGVNLARYENFIQTDASINPGNSGGPLFNLKGEVIGINTAIINFAQGIGFAIPSNMAKKISTQLKESGKVIRGWLGIGIQPLTEELASNFGVEESEGVLVNEVFDGDPAFQAGVKPGDIIIGINGKVVNTPSSLSRMIAGIAPGEKIEIEVIRDQKKEVLKATLIERKDQATLAAIPPKPEKDIGINVQDLTKDLAEKFKLKESKGALITQIEPDSPADKGGLKEGDLVREVNRTMIENSDDFYRAMDSTKKGENVLLRILREDRAFFQIIKTKEE